ncbi:MAG: metallophosphoesterase family protein [Thermoproteota archaeon]
MRLRLFACSDMHLGLESVERALRDSKGADLAVCLGDITVHGRGLENALKTVRRLNENVMIIPGNNETPKALEEKATPMGFTCLHAKTVSFKGFTFAGVGGSPHTIFKTPFEMSEDEFRAILSGFRGLGNLILLSHAPPFKTTLDLTSSRDHIGSIELRKFIEEESPLICLCGHVHERAGLSERMGRTLLINPGPKGMVLEV